MAEQVSLFITFQKGKQVIKGNYNNNLVFNFIQSRTTLILEATIENLYV